jgi:acylphosphatase
MTYNSKKTMARVRAHLFISGRVQGVFFRACTREEAEKRNLTGWVKNLCDGRVEAVFEGDEKVVQSMISWCHNGPPQAVVSGVSVEVEEPGGEYTRFEIR